MKKINIIPTTNITSVRDVMKDRMRDLLAEHFKIGFDEVDTDLVIAITEEAFSVCGIPEKEQDESWD